MQLPQKRICFCKCFMSCFIHSYLRMPQNKCREMSTFLPNLNGDQNSFWTVIKILCERWSKFSLNGDQNSLRTVIKILCKRWSKFSSIEDKVPSSYKVLIIFKKLPLQQTVHSSLTHLTNINTRTKLQCWLEYLVSFLIFVFTMPSKALIKYKYICAYIFPIVL